MPGKVIVLLAVLAFAVAAISEGRAESEADRIARVTAPVRDFSKPEKYEAMQGGAATYRKRIDSNAFSHPSANMALERRLLFEVGDGMFNKIWVSSPASTKSSDGLGPLYNARSCQRCHLKDGRGAPPDVAGSAGLLVRLGVPAHDAGEGRMMPDPVYGRQLQTFAVPGMQAEGRVRIDYEPVPVRLGDGTVITLRKPVMTLEDPAHGPFRDDLMLSARVAPAMIGLGLLEAIAGEDILALADPDDRDGDGISGRANRVMSVARREIMLGRFGWKAGEASLPDQVAGAFSGDIGISTSLYPANAGDCTGFQPACLAAPHGGGAGTGAGVEIGDRLFDMTVFYSGNLAVPARRDVGAPDVLAGKRIFYQSGCIACHRPKYVTPRDPSRPEQSFQLVWPYTDLLLHDMGEGLADNRPGGRLDGGASGREWRTPPLWGIGLVETVNGHTNFLHDGRARNLLEAILWHGGEAQAARDRVIALSGAERAQLLRFLNSL